MSNRKRLYWVAAGALGLALLPLRADAALTAGTEQLYSWLRTADAQQQSVGVSHSVDTIGKLNVSIAQNTPVIHPSQNDREQSLKNAVSSYITDNTEVNEFTLKVEVIEGDFARLRVVPSGEVTDPAWIFARQDATGWTILDLGTFFDEEFYNELGVPAALQLK